MKWIDNKPKEGDRRIATRFAWNPISIDGYKVWMEYYTVEEEYREVFRGITMPRLLREWVVIRYLNRDETNIGAK